MSTPTDDTRRLRELIQRANEFLGNGGFFNPEMMKREAAGVLVMELRNALQESLEDAAVTPEGRQVCGVVGEPEAGRMVCELHAGHDGYHQQGRVRWLGYHLKADGRQTPETPKP